MTNMNSSWTVMYHKHSLANIYKYITSTARHEWYDAYRTDVYLFIFSGEDENNKKDKRKILWVVIHKAGICPVFIRGRQLKKTRIYSDLRNSSRISFLFCSILSWGIQCKNRLFAYKETFHFLSFVWTTFSICIVAMFLVQSTVVAIA